MWLRLMETILTSYARVAGESFSTVPSSPLIQSADTGQPRALRGGQLGTESNLGESQIFPERNYPKPTALMREAGAHGTGTVDRVGR